MSEREQLVLETERKMRGLCIECGVREAPSGRKPECPEWYKCIQCALAVDPKMKELSQIYDIEVIRG